MGARKDAWEKAKRENKVRELDFRKILFSESEIGHARAVVAAGAKAAHDCDTETCDAAVLMEHLGLLPGQEGWYEHTDKLARRPQDG
jgi:hypothetical protein